MADIELVIKIPDEEYQNYLKMRPAYPEDVFCYIKAIQNGTPLPEHHGRLIDENDLAKLYDADDRLWWSNAMENIKEGQVPIIIEGSDSE